MGKVTDIAKNILNRNPKNSASLISFYNYLKNFCAIQSELNEQQLSNYFGIIHSFSHWQSQAHELSKNIDAVLSDFPQSQYKSFQKRQIIRIKDEVELEVLWKKYFHHKSTSKLRTISKKDGRYLLLVLHLDQKLDVYDLDSQFCMQNGELVPIRKDFYISYDSNMKIIKDKWYMLNINPHSIVRFCKHGNETRIQQFKGYSLHKSLDGKALSIENHKELFYALKKQETHFIHKSSDPLYQKAIQDTESAIDQLTDKSENCIEYSRRTYNTVKSLYENIFQDDRLLHLLLKELATMLASQAAFLNPLQENETQCLEQRELDPYDSTNLLPIVE